VFRWSDAATQVCIVDWQDVLMIGERPSAGKGSSTMTIEILSIQDTCQHRTPYFFGRNGRLQPVNRWLASSFARMNAQKITCSGYPLCKAPMLNHGPASICPRNWHDADERLFRSAFRLMPGAA
jgi:hypothetical protein